MITKEEIAKTIGGYENTRELIDLIRQMSNDMDVLKSAVANLMDETFGSTRGWTEEREVPMLENRLNVSKEMARVMLAATDETRDNNAFDII